ncbi:hypothetical protein Y032_0057g2805 [Ancylostoma ceylanicum]|uniref:Uncharacterized protein n=1 Tax=Ancylostoma ceylanicum TaxID=53326 RepID=A0A016U4G4_9BILA|nr:hypothetical protein Y032_0057g2805 [Ancylostoma ceylanicum]
MQSKQRNVSTRNPSIIFFSAAAILPSTAAMRRKAWAAIKVRMAATGRGVAREGDHLLLANRELIEHAGPPSRSIGA